MGLLQDGIDWAKDTFLETNTDADGNETTGLSGLGGLLSLAAAYGLSESDLFDADITPTGYQGTVKDYTAVRDRVPMQYDPNRRPGQGGQRYFSDMRYATAPASAPPTVEEARAASQAQAQQLGTQNFRRGGLARLFNDPVRQQAIRNRFNTGRGGSRFGRMRDQLGSGRNAMRSGLGSMYSQQQAQQAQQQAIRKFGQPIQPIDQAMPAAPVQEPVIRKFGQPINQNNLQSAAQALYSQRAAQPTQPIGQNNLQSAYQAMTDAVMPQPAPSGGIMSAPDFMPGAPPTATEQKPTAGRGVASLMGQGFAEGGYLNGATDGMADEVPATIEGRQPARLSDGEFVIPADVVSHLGNGNSEAGAKVLQEMMSRVRKERTGNPKQGKKIKPEKVTPK